MQAGVHPTANPPTTNDTHPRLIHPRVHKSRRDHRARLALRPRGRSLDVRDQFGVISPVRGAEAAVENAEGGWEKRPGANGPDDAESRQYITTTITVTSKWGGRGGKSQPSMSGPELTGAREAASEPDEVTGKKR